MESYLSKLKIIKYNSKILFNLNVIAAIVVAALIPIIFSFRLLNFSEMAQISERIISIIGILLLPFIAHIEKRDNIEEVIFPKKTHHALIFLLRYFLLSLLVILIIFALCIVAKLQGAEFNISKILFGTSISAIFFGTLGLTVSNLTRTLSSGYLIGFAYYLFDYMSHGKYTKSFYSFSLMNNSFSEKYYLLAVTGILFLINVIYVHWKSNHI